jgi:hypothetical protein
MRNSSRFKVAVLLVFSFVAAGSALAQTLEPSEPVDAQALATIASLRGERQLALSEATQTIQRFFSCISEGVNADTDPVRSVRAAACQRAELHPNAIVVFNGIPLNGANEIVATFTGSGVGAVQFGNTILDVHTIIDKEFQRRSILQDARLKLRATVVATFNNTITTPVLPLPPGNFIFHAAEDFELVEEDPGRWQIMRVDVQPLSRIPIPENSFFTPFPILPGIPRNP